MALSPSLSTATVSEKPFHYKYLKEFRVEQCQLFLQHKCTQHRPFTCFNWHFMNQRRRRPVRRLKDGVFNYSPDVYCTLYDETSGICPNGDDCPYLHRNGGDTERRYHLRYYKTSTCVYETDSRGFCVKNGPHCAFAHGPNDLRQAVYDARELQGDDDNKVPLFSNLEKDKGVLIDDPRWQDHSFVLTYYKTEHCKRPPRLCRQGYACPFFHNNKDRRRTPKQFNYRSTPCPNVKVNDEWGDPVHCENGDTCTYCHSRTEQQFHPEIYKSTKCNDIQQTGYCPRGPFCAFAHGDTEISAPRLLTDEPMLSYPSPVASMSSTGSTGGDLDILGTSPGSKLPKLQPQTTEKPVNVGFSKAPGAEFRGRSPESEEGQMYIYRQLTAIDNDNSLDETEKVQRKQSIMKLSLGPNLQPSSGSPLVPQASSLPSSVSDTLEAMVGPSLDDLTLDDITTTLDTADTPEAEGPSGRLFGRSPMAQGFMQSFSPHTTTSMAYSTPLGPLSPYGLPTATSQGTGTSPRLGTHSGYTFSSGPAISPSTGVGSPLFMSGHTHSSTIPPHQTSQKQPVRRLSHGPAGSSPDVELQMLKEELALARSKLSNWEQAWRQARSACDAWRREAEEAKYHMQTMEQEKQNLLAKFQLVETEGLKHPSGQKYLKGLVDVSDLSKLPLSELENLASHIRRDLDSIEQTLRHRLSTLCTQCKQFTRSVAFQPCGHCLLCDTCTEKLSSVEQPKCPHCKTPIGNWSSIKLPP